MKPLDPRLLRHARAARRYIVTTTVTGAATAGLVVGQAVLISLALAPVIAGEAGIGQVWPLVALLALVVAARGLVLLIQEALAHRAATRTIIELRRQVLEHAAALGPRWQAEHGPDTATLVTRGLEDLEPYFTRYLPQLLLAATVTPATVLVLFTQDWPSTVAVILTIPLIPIFMILIGRMTVRLSTERLEAMERLGSQVLDLIAGLPTLKALGREEGPARRVRALGRSYRLATMSTLRMAFLSGAVLEFITTLSVAIIAVEVGFRLLFGQLDLTTALLVLMIAPEAYQPIRQVGFHFHASANGVAAAETVFEVLQTPAPRRGSHSAPDLSRATIVITDLSVVSRGSLAPHGLSALIPPGRITALVGPSGAGKTTTTQVLLGLLPADEGGVSVRLPDGERVELEQIDPVSWWAQISWVPQRPAIVPGTLLDNILGESRAGEPDGRRPVPEALEAAARATGLTEVVASLPQGWHTVIGQGGIGLSLGQRQRLALTRALVSPAPLVVMDEPTAHLDAASEAHVLDGVRALSQAGRTVVVIAHRPALIALADEVIEVTAGGAAPDCSAEGDGRDRVDLGAASGGLRRAAPPAEAASRPGPDAAREEDR
ncbi:thiol reductant ABC exporter subunit CydD [Actinomyces slackii]|uniref:ATP-binding/permease protein CydD n=1 Tax=Actinomyces slackii TaxID=52774 RepID=A0A448KDB1_9ACTO|nr:thiol reductant ABC exporter subunit CydD [Actinomyces slackii]VEG74926.1 ATP-binding/permease protein CydD [Actinomyces slackii]